MTDKLITDSVIKGITKRLRAVNPKWATDMGKLISERSEWKKHSKNPCTENNARNIGGAVIKSQMHRRVFLVCAGKLLNEAAEESLKALEQVNL